MMNHQHPDTGIYLSGLISVTTKSPDGTGGYVWCLNEMADAILPRSVQDERLSLYTERPHPTWQAALEAGIRYCYANRPDLVKAASKFAIEAEQYRRSHPRVAS